MPGLPDQSLKLNTNMPGHTVKRPKDPFLMVINWQCISVHTSSFPNKTKKLNMHAGPTYQKGKSC
jgi:hypothetical protein